MGGIYRRGRRGRVLRHSGHGGRGPRDAHGYVSLFITSIQHLHVLITREVAYEQPQSYQYTLLLE